MFSYIFYRIYAFYFYCWKESVPGVYTISLVSFLQFLNILTLQNLLEYSINFSLSLSNEVVLFVLFAIIIINYFLYNFSALEKKYKEESESKRRLKGFSVIAYIICSILFFLTTIIFFAS